jgi:hypothetical protein
LDLFNGQLSLTDIMSVDVAVLNELIEAKQKLLMEKEKSRADAMNSIGPSNDDYSGYY